MALCLLYRFPQFPQNVSFIVEKVEIFSDLGVLIIANAPKNVNPPDIRILPVPPSSHNKLLCPKA